MAAASNSRTTKNDDPIFEALAEAHALASLFMATCALMDEVPGEIAGAVVEEVNHYLQACDEVRAHLDGQADVDRARDLLLEIEKGIYGLSKMLPHAETYGRRGDMSVEALNVLIVAMDHSAKIRAILARVPRKVAA